MGFYSFVIVLSSFCSEERYFQLLIQTDQQKTFLIGTSNETFLSPSNIW